MKFFNSTPSFRIQLLTAICVNVISFSHGIVIGWLSPYLPVLQSEDSPLRSGAITTEQTSWIGSLVCVGGLTGNFLARAGSEKFGHKKAILLLVIPQVAFWFSVRYSTEVYHLYIARILGGITGGGAFTTIPLYIARIAEPKIRGTIGSLLPLSCNIGILYGFTLGLFLDYYTFPFVMLIFPVLFVIIFMFFPETPQYLLKRNLIEEAESSLRFYRGIKKDENLSKTSIEELERMKVANAELEDNNSKVQLKDFGTREALVGMSIGVVLMALNQFSGGFAIITYSAKVFKDANSNIEPKVASIIIAFLQILGTYTATILTDRMGRKILLIISTIGIAFGLIILGIFSYLSEEGYDVKAYGIIPLLSLSFVIFIGCIGISTLPFIIVAEVLPMKIRSVGSSICLATLTCSAFIVLKFFPILCEILQLYGCMWVFSFICILGTIFIIFVVPETNGKILDETADKTKSESRRSTDEIKA